MERYTRLRAASRELSHKMVKTVPREAILEVGEAIGILWQDTLVFESEDISSVLMDCCLHDWVRGGKKVVQRYAESHPAPPGTDEAFLLDAYLKAGYRLLLPQSAVPGAGVRCRDAISGQELFLMDAGFSRTLGEVKMALATRIVPLGEYWMTSGAALPLSAAALQDFLSTLSAFTGDPLDASGLRPRVALQLVRACLASGAAESIRYEGGEEESREARQKAKGKRRK